MFYKHREALLNRDVPMFFGLGGYIDIVDGEAVAHITVARYRLATQDFSELVNKHSPQELTVSEAGLVGMLKHLRVPDTASAQRRCRSYLELKSN